ncbi:NAD(+) kinase [Opacimonas viscosa]|uniref:NAD kinase n=1 Tax=Opacimonas viscosa TaxID=2961944 RepID=A0AA41WX45_9ALTE|nr:NAD(+) kinase [Opacimonas viscosa]MCP3427680.1 NAD(+) kinase [Opacimonas viscosa]
MKYQTVGLIGKPDHEGTHVSLTALTEYLTKQGCKILIETRLHAEMNDERLTAAELVTIGHEADLAIVVGGDGNMLGAARVLARFDIDVVGVNRGNLGFLTDISPDNIENELDTLFAGKGKSEQRFLLEVDVFRHESLKSTNVAVNEVVLHHGKVAHMMEFEVYINDQFMFSQRSDGLIIATPTGSTAYSLSGGGPILMPTLDALTLVPMFPHTLTSRPIVVDADSTITLRVSKVNSDTLQVSCDSHIALNILPGDEVVIRKSPNKLTIVHPPSYDYFNVLRTKLNWGTKLY